MQLICRLPISNTEIESLHYSRRHTCTKTMGVSHIESMTRYLCAGKIVYILYAREEVRNTDK